MQVLWFRVVPMINWLDDEHCKTIFSFCLHKMWDFTFFCYIINCTSLFPGLFVEKSANWGYYLGLLWNCNGHFQFSDTRTYPSDGISLQEAALSGAQPSFEGDHRCRSAVPLCVLPVDGWWADSAVWSSLGSHKHRLWNVLAYSTGEHSIEPLWSTSMASLIFNVTGKLNFN